MIKLGEWVGLVLIALTLLWFFEKVTDVAASFIFATFFR